jgi:hypothetical protein
MILSSEIPVRIGHTNNYKPLVINPQYITYPDKVDFEDRHWDKIYRMLNRRTNKFENIYPHNNENGQVTLTLSNVKKYHYLNDALVIYLVLHAVNEETKRRHEQGLIDYRRSFSLASFMPIIQRVFERMDYSKMFKYVVFPIPLNCLMEVNGEVSEYVCPMFQKMMWAIEDWSASAKEVGYMCREMCAYFWENGIQRGFKPLVRAGFEDRYAALTFRLNQFLYLGYSFHPDIAERNPIPHKSLDALLREFDTSKNLTLAKSFFRRLDKFYHCI